MRWNRAFLFQNKHPKHPSPWKNERGSAKRKMGNAQSCKSCSLFRFQRKMFWKERKRTRREQIPLVASLLSTSHQNAVVANDGKRFWCKRTIRLGSVESTIWSVRETRNTHEKNLQPIKVCVQRSVKKESRNDFTFKETTQIFLLFFSLSSHNITSQSSRISLSLETSGRPRIRTGLPFLEWWMQDKFQDIVPPGKSNERRNDATTI